MSIENKINVSAKWDCWNDLGLFLQNWFLDTNITFPEIHLYRFFLIKPFYEGRLNQIILRGKPEGNKSIKANLKIGAFLAIYFTLKESRKAPMLFEFDKLYVNIPKDIIL